MCSFLLFFNDTATTEIYTLSLHDALPICQTTTTIAEHGFYGQTWTLWEHTGTHLDAPAHFIPSGRRSPALELEELDRKSTRLNSSHANISYAVFCLKKKNVTPRLEEQRSQ